MVSTELLEPSEPPELPVCGFTEVVTVSFVQVLLDQTEAMEATVSPAELETLEPLFDVEFLWRAGSSHAGRHGS
jgi:hypothetical protein